MKKLPSKIFRCAVCGETHDELPDIGSPAPWHWNDEYENTPGCLLTDDLCIIENRDYFVRGIIEIPVQDYAHAFGWGVWISHKKENFETYREHFDSSAIGPFFGWLCTEIEYYEQSTRSLKTMANYRGDGFRPQIILAECDHPLYQQQRDGITLETAWKIVHHYMNR